MSDGEKFVASAKGATSSRVPRVDLIPYRAIVRLAARFEYGLQRHGLDNWRKGLGDEEYMLERAAHVALHALQFINKRRGYLLDDGEDDIGAILWGGAFLAEAIEHIKPKTIKRGKPIDPTSV